MAGNCFNFGFESWLAKETMVASIEWDWMVGDPSV